MYVLMIRINFIIMHRCRCPVDFAITGLKENEPVDTIKTLLK